MSEAHATTTDALKHVIEQCQCVIGCRTCKSARMAVDALVAKDAEIARLRARLKQLSRELANAK